MSARKKLSTIDALELQMKRMTSQQLDTAIQVSLSAILGLAVFAIYGRTVGYGFVLYDDMIYVVNNENLKDGLNFGNIFWIFTSSFFNAQSELSVLGLDIGHKGIKVDTIVICRYFV